MKSRTCCFTGHRNIPKELYPVIQSQLYDILDVLIQKGVTYFGFGGAIGFDLLCAEVILLLKRKYPHIKLIMVCPCRFQERFWQSEDIQRYHNIQLRCDKVVYLSEQYDPMCMRRRNIHLIEYSYYCICYLNRTYGGTYFTVQYAKHRGLYIINIADLL